MDFDYSEFGPAGAMYQAFYYSLWCDLRDHWNSLARERSYHPFETVLNSFTPGDLWWTAFLMIKDALTEAEFSKLWEKFSQIFSPALTTDFESGTPIAAQKFELLLLLAAISSSPLRLFVRNGLNQFCEGGPFSTEEMSFLLENHPRMVQMASGTGYLALLFALRRGDFVGLDSYEYGDAINAEEWMANLFKMGKLRRGGCDTLAELADRTLVISWAEPRSAIPADALRAYYAAGGKHFAFKLGGFCGAKLRSARPASEILSPFAQPLTLPVPQGPEQLVQFFTELSINWIASAKRLPFRPGQFENALWMFERKEH